MPNALNTEFLSNPLTFIQNADYAVGGHDDLVQAMGGTRVSTLVRGTELYRNAEVFLGYVDALGVISFELVKFKDGSRKMVVMRPVVDPAIFQMKEIGKSFAAPPSNPIRGYWFPYKVPTPEQMTAAKKSGGGGSPKVMGYVDFEKRDLIFGDKSAVVMFTVMDTAVSEPIPDQPLSNSELIASYNAWDKRCKEWAAFRFGKKVDNVRVIDGR